MKGWREGGKGDGWMSEGERKEVREKGREGENILRTYLRTYVPAYVPTYLPTLPTYLTYLPT